METMEAVSCSLVTASPCGRYITGITGGKLRVHSIAANPPRCADYDFRAAPRDLSSLKWSTDSTRILLLSSKSIEVLDLENCDHRVRIDNGSAGLGHLESADFLHDDILLTTWQFGKAKVWDLETGKGFDVADLKTTGEGRTWQLRTVRGRQKLLAVVSRPGAEDVLTLYLLEPESVFRRLTAVKLKTMDAQSLSWSSDGRWLAIFDTPTASQSVHFHTPDGHLYRSYPPSPELDHLGLGAKSLEWSSDGSTVALLSYEGKVEILNARTFALRATLEHTTTIDQQARSKDVALSTAAPVLEETVSASKDRSYTLATQPFSLPLTRQTKSTSELHELGMAEACFSCDSVFLATRDCRTLSTVWVWSANNTTLTAIIIQHSNVRKMHWHPSHQELLMLDCGEGIAYIWNAARPDEPPMPVLAALQGNVSLEWLPQSDHVDEAHPAILVKTRSTFSLLHPFGRPTQSVQSPACQNSTNAAFDEGVSEDSLFEVLTGRKGSCQDVAAPSYTEQVSVEADAFSSSEHLDDTFREKRKAKAEIAEVDPFDDSEIF